MAETRIAFGSTLPGGTNWRLYNFESGGVAGTGIVVDIDTSSGKFMDTPVYVTSIGGDQSHWLTTGATSIYEATPIGFRIYVRWVDGSPLDPSTANEYKWHINWIGIAIDGVPIVTTGTSTGST